MKTTTRTTAFLATAAAASVVGLSALAGAADARCVIGDAEVSCPQVPTKVHHVGRVVVAQGQTLGVRAIPKQNSAQVRQLPNGGKVRIVCEVRGSKVKGTYGPTTLWHKLKAGGYVSDAYVYTGSNGPVAPAC